MKLAATIYTRFCISSVDFTSYITARVCDSGRLMTTICIEQPFLWIKRIMRDIVSLVAKKSRNIDKSRTVDNLCVHAAYISTLLLYVTLLRLVSRVSIHLSGWEHGGIASEIPCVIHIDTIRVVSLCVFSQPHDQRVFCRASVNYVLNNSAGTLNNLRYFTVIWVEYSNAITR